MSDKELQDDVEFSEFCAKLEDEFRTHFEEMDHASLAKYISQQSSKRNPKHSRNSLGNRCNDLVKSLGKQ